MMLMTVVIAECVRCGESLPDSESPFCSVECEEIYETRMAIAVPESAKAETCSQCDAPVFRNGLCRTCYHYEYE